MRLITKINIHFGIILAALMVMVFTFTQHFFQKELETQMKSSLDVTYESFKLTLEQIFNEQKMKALNQTNQDIIGIATKDRIASVLNYYLSLAAKDYHLNLIEVVDTQGVIIADNFRSYENHPMTVPFKKPEPPDLSAAYLTLRDEKAYLMTTTPISFSGARVGYMNVGTLINQYQVNYLASILSSELLFYADGRVLASSPGQRQFPFSAVASHTLLTVRPILFRACKSASPIMIISFLPFPATAPSAPSWV